MKSLLLILGSTLVIYLFATPALINNSTHQESTVYDAITGATKHAKKQKQKSKKDKNQAKTKQTSNNK